MNKLTLNLTDTEVLKLHMLASSINANIEDIIHIAIDDYIKKVEQFDASQKSTNNTFKL